MLFFDISQDYHFLVDILPPILENWNACQIITEMLKTIKFKMEQYAFF
jgi:hypothetical protein